MIQETKDIIHSPNHYTWRGRECKHIIRDLVQGEEGINAHCVASVVKYLYRYPKKQNPLQDLKKAREYLTIMIEEMESQPGGAVIPGKR